MALLHLDSSLAIVNKGAGLVSVPAPGCELSALSILADFLAGRLRARDRSVAGKSLPPAYARLEPGPVHRLDQYTTGLLCIAMNPAARQQLIEQLKTHAMQREYVAFAHGHFEQPRGTWRHWLQLGKDQLRQHVVSAAEAQAPQSEAQEAVTHYEVLTEFALGPRKGVVSKLRLRLETGRKHQIRAQAAHVGAPLIGDRVYHPAYRGRDRGIAPIEFDRQALHAQALTLEHPAQPGQRLTWRAEMPRDLRQLEAALRALAAKKSSEVEPNGSTSPVAS